MVPYSGRSRRKAKSSLSSLSLFYDPCTRMNFNIDTAFAISMIPACRRYRTYFGPQNSIDTNINVGVRYTLAWIFKVANVSIPIIGTNFLRHFGLGVDAVNNAFILSHDSVCRQHNTSHSAVNYVSRISCASASHAIKSPPLSTSSTDVINKFPLEACAAHNAVHNLDAANAIAHSIHELVRNFADLPNIHDAATSFFQQRPEDPPARSDFKPRRSSRPSFSNGSNANVSKHNALAENRGLFAYCPPTKLEMNIGELLQLDYILMSKAIYK